VNDRVGDVRPSQLLYTYGIGSIVDLQRMSVMVLGLDDWSELDTTPISEPRLLRAVQDVHQDVTELRIPPRPKPTQADRAQQLIGVPVAPFPRWLRCRRCQTIAPAHTGMFRININQYKPEEAEYVHANCLKTKGKARAFPVRFLVACEHGHLDDFPWDSYVHRGQPCPRGGSSLRLSESGTAGEAADVFVTCNACEMKRPMTQAFGASRGESGLMACTGRYPHLREYDAETCGMPMKAILLGASHLWFPRVYSALHIPRITDEIDLLVDESKDDLANIKALGEITFFRQYRGADFRELMAYNDEEIWEAIERQRAVDDVSAEDDEGLGLPPSAQIKRPEWEALTNPDAIAPTRDFRLRRVDVPAPYRSVLESVVLVERLREVRAFIGFNRWKSMNEFGDASGVGNDADRLAPIRRKDEPLTWVPAADVRGEGIFIQLREDVVQEWEVRVWETAWANTFRQAYTARLKARGLSGGPDTASFRRILLHSLSHALMREFALESGYAAASLQERIFALAPGHGGAEMAGVLIYTAASDSEGTLGGLVRLGESAYLEKLLNNALESIRICSTDPLCAEHTPDTELGLDLHGAACHTCLFAPETSCEMGNQWLDRGVLVETFARQGTEWFGSQP
jgi:hypothetical protein